MPTDPTLRPTVIEHVGRGTRRDDIIDQLCPTLDEPNRKGYLVADVDREIDLLVEEGLLAEVQFGHDRGWLVNAEIMPQSAKRIREKNDAYFEKHATQPKKYRDFDFEGTTRVAAPGTFIISEAM